MRIAFFTDTYLPRFDGVTFVVDSWAQHLSKRHEVKVFAPAYARKRMTEKRMGFTVERFQSLPVPSSDRLHFVIPDFFGEIFDTVKSFRPEIIHLHSLGVLSLVATRISKKLDIPLVGTYHSLLSEMMLNFPPFDMLANVFEPGNGEEGLIRKTGWGLTKLIYAKCDLIVAPAPAIKKDLRKHGFKNWTEVVSNGLDLNNFQSLERKKFSYEILHVGRISSEKRVGVIVKGFARVEKVLPNIRLTIVGDGMDLVNIKQMVADLKLSRKIRFTGFVARHKLGNYYAKADFFVTASTMEVQPLVILEALAAGLPVIAVNKAGIEGGDVKNGHNGYLIDDQSEDLLADKILEAYQNLEKWKKMQGCARKTAEENSIDKSINKIERFYKKLVSG